MSQQQGTFTFLGDLGKSMALSTAPPVRAAAPMPTRALPAIRPATAPPVHAITLKKHSSQPESSRDARHGVT